MIARKSLACHTIHLNTVLKAVAVCAVIFNRLIVMCCFYIPPACHLASSDSVRSINTNRRLQHSFRTDAWGRLIENLTSMEAYQTKSSPKYHNTEHDSYSYLGITIGSAVVSDQTKGGWSSSPIYLKIFLLLPNDCDVQIHQSFSC